MEEMETTIGGTWARDLQIPTSVKYDFKEIAAHVRVAYSTQTGDAVGIHLTWMPLCSEFNLIASFSRSSKDPRRDAKLGAKDLNSGFAAYGTIART